MTDYKVLLSVSAEIDICDTITYYKNISPKIANKLVDTVQKQIENILIFPFAYPVKFKNFRSKIIHGFPYLIIYDIEEDTIYINRIFNFYQKTAL